MIFVSSLRAFSGIQHPNHGSCRHMRAILTTGRRTFHPGISIDFPAT